MAESDGCIYVLAGTNGAGKSTALGAYLGRRGADYINPDELTRELMAADPSLSLNDANSRAWYINRDALETAINRRATYSFETTLGGSTITQLLERALDSGMEVRMLYVGLASPELHIARVQARVALGGHAIDENTIRTRYDSSRQNLLRLLPRLSELALYDNSEEAALKEEPRPVLLLVTRAGQAEFIADLDLVPDWAKPIVEFGIRSK